MQGTYSKWQMTKDENPSFVCRVCNSDEVRYRTWESACGGFEDVQYHCLNCWREWWVEGPDA